MSGIKGYNKQALGGLSAKQEAVRVTSIASQLPQQWHTRKDLTILNKQTYGWDFTLDLLHLILGLRQL